VTGRYAPSPTGDLHVGNLRTALLAWLFARSAGGRFLMRMEDLDSQRVRPGMEERQLADLAAIGIDWDGPVVRQSERRSLYEDALDRLDTYPCFCTRAEIREAASAPHGPVGAYPGTCRELSAAERRVREALGRPPALRVRAQGAHVEVVDLMLGSVSGTVDDFVVRRGDGVFAYNLAVVVDDADQRVDQVVRGSDLADSAPRQAWLARTLGFAEPIYAHVPLVLGPDGKRLAKRHGAVTRDEHTLRWIATSLGLQGDTADELLAHFDPAGIPAEPTVLHPH
jgi:glutamyl-tRNA synthetase